VAVDAIDVNVIHVKPAFARRWDNAQSSTARTPWPAQRLVFEPQTPLPTSFNQVTLHEQHSPTSKRPPVLEHRIDRRELRHVADRAVEPARSPRSVQRVARPLVRSAASRRFIQCLRGAAPGHDMDGSAAGPTLRHPTPVGGPALGHLAGLSGHGEGETTGSGCSLRRVANAFRCSKPGIGRPLDEFARASLLEPLGITGEEWSRMGRDSDAGDGLRMRPRDMAKIGQLVLASGRWDGRQIVSKGWIEASNASLTKATDDQDYGYLVERPCRCAPTDSPLDRCARSRRAIDPHRARARSRRRRDSGLLPGLQPAGIQGAVRRVQRCAAGCLTAPVTWIT